MTLGHQDDSRSEYTRVIENEEENEQVSSTDTPGSLRGTLNNILQGLRDIVDLGNKRPISPISKQLQTAIPLPQHLVETEDVPTLSSSFADADESEMDNKSETKTVETVKSLPKLRQSKRRTKFPGHLQHYSMCMVSNPRQSTPENIEILKGNPNSQAIPPDAYTPSVQQTFGIQPTHMRNISTSNSQVLHYVFTQYSLQ